MFPRRIIIIEGRKKMNRIKGFILEGRLQRTKYGGRIWVMS